MSENTVADGYSRAHARAYIDMALRFIGKNEHISVDEIRPRLDEETLRIGQLERLVEYAPTARSAADLLSYANIESDSFDAMS